MKTMLLCPELFARESGIQRTLRLYLKVLCEGGGGGDTVDLVVLNDRELPASRLAEYSNDRLRIRRACSGDKARFLWAAVHGSSGADRLLCGHIGQLVAPWLARCFNPRLDYYLVAHGIEVWRPYSALEKIALRRARRILCVSEFTRREMQRGIDLPEQRFAVVPNALDPFFDDASSDGATSGGPPVILSVARLDPAERYKGVDHLIEALPGVRRALPGTRLRVIGSGDDLPRLMAMAGQNGVTDAVDFSGFIDDAKLRDAYRECTLFALPSRGEGFGIVFLEAMARGKPCLGARAGAIPEIIDAASGVLADYGDVPQITVQLVSALERRWDPVAIKARAAQFSYPAFKRRLEGALNLRLGCGPVQAGAGAA
jgi:phosphatidyl-myo-inositol dimannoside synthase